MPKGALAVHVGGNDPHRAPTAFDDSSAHPGREPKCRSGSLSCRQCTARNRTVKALAGRPPFPASGGGAALGRLGGNYPHYMALVASRTSAAEVGRVVGDMQAAGQIGGTIGPLIGGVVAGELGLPAAFFASSLVGLSAIVVVGLFVRPDAAHRREVAAGPRRGSLHAAFARPEQRRLMLLLLVGD